METGYKSGALEVNLAETKQGQTALLPKHRWFVSLSAAYWAINKRTEELFLEYNHLHPNYDYIIENLHTISLSDLWLYTSIEESNEALLFLVSIFEELIDRPLDEKQREQLLKTLFKFIDRLLEEDRYPSGAIRRCLALIEKCMAADEKICIRNSGYFKKYLPGAAAVPEFNRDVCRMTKAVLRKSCEYWAQTTHAEAWFASKKALFQLLPQEKIDLIGDAFFHRLSRRIGDSQTWEEIESNLFYNDIANYFRHFTEEFALSIEKVYYLLFVLHLPGMVQLKKHLLYDLNRLIRTALSDLDPSEMTRFIEMLFRLFGELKDQQTGTVLDCLFTLGKEIVCMDNPDIIDHYTQHLIEFGFVYPGKIEITSDWETIANTDHVKNIRIWLDLIKTAPYKFKKLLSALVVNLKLGGIFISDTDLFQRDISRLLNADITPVYKQVKQLARVFPVYFNEIGAEGRLREVSTMIDEVAGRQDRLIHFVRKQIHTESNNTHVELVGRVAGYWFGGERGPLQPILPADVTAALDEDNALFAGTRKAIRAACEYFEVDPVGLLKLPGEEVSAFLDTLESGNQRDKKRLLYLVELYQLLLEKYSFETRDIAGLLVHSRFFADEKIDRLRELMDQKRYRQAIAQLYDFMSVLREIILSAEQTQAAENIYHKRHIAAGIPSMYGQYREPKFEALGLMYRLEQVASCLLERILEQVELEYISARTMQDIYDVLVLFKNGLALDGMVNQNFNSTLEMYRYSLTSTSVTLSQYMNIFQFLSQHIKELINEYFIRVYDETISIVIPQIFDGSPETIAKEAEIFYRGILSSAFLVQELDRFIVNALKMINAMLENYSADYIQNMMSYDPDLAISPLDRETPEMDNQVFLGAKAYYLKKLIDYGMPVPPGFVLTTEVYRHKSAIFEHPYMIHELNQMILAHLAEIEEKTNLKFGGPERPMLLSVRSGTAISMPGAMSTFLNVGMTDEIAFALAEDPGKAWMSWDAYRRFIQSWGMSYGIDRDCFDALMARAKLEYGVERKTGLPVSRMKDLAFEYKRTLNEHGISIAENPYDQLQQAINNTFHSWSSPRAKAFRKHLQVADEWGTAVIVQKMVMGNRSLRSGSGVVFTHNPKLKKPGVNLYGDFTLCSQGEDIVAGLVYPLPISESQRTDLSHDNGISLESGFPRIYRRLHRIAIELIEKYGFNNQEIEFTFESEAPQDLYILQIREQNIVEQEKRAVFSTPAEEMALIGRGIGAGGGSMSGVVSFDLEDLYRNKKAHPGANHILIRPDTVPDDIQMIFMCDGLVTSRGGVTSHAAVAADKLGKVCIVNCEDLVVNDQEKSCTINACVLRRGDTISIDGKMGNIFIGSYPVEYV